MRSGLVVLLGLAAGCARAYPVPPADAIVEARWERTETIETHAAIDVMIWNVHKRRGANFAAEWARRHPGLELVLLQEEVWPADERIPAGWARAKSFQIARRDRATGVATATTVGTARAWAVRSRDREPLTRTPKLALLTEHRVADARLLVVNVHLLNFAGMPQFGRMLDDVVAAISEHDGPVLIAGDFNTRTRARTRRMEAGMSSLGLQPVAWPDDRRTRVAGQPLDHVWVRGLIVEDPRVITARRASDHAALTLTVRAEPDAAQTRR